MASTCKEPFPMMTTAVKCGKLLGLWHDTEPRKPRWQTVFVMASLLFWYIIPGLAFITRQEKTIPVLAKSITEVYGMTTIIFRLFVHMVHRAKLQQYFLEIQAELTNFDDSPHEDIRRTLKHLQKSSQYLVKIYIPMVMIPAMNYGVIPATLTTVKFMLSNGTVELPAAVMEADFVLFDHKSNFWIWLSVALASMLVHYCMVGSISAQECLYWNLLHHVSCLFRIVRMEISRLDWHKDPTEFKKQLASIIATHEVCYRSARCLETVIYPMMGLLYCSCIFLICLLMFIVSMVNDFITIASMAFVLQYIMFMIFAFSMLGTELMEESTLISNAIYNTRWYERSVTERRLLLFMQMRSDQTVGITAGKFFLVDRSTFAATLKTAYSCFTVLQQSFGNE